MHAVVASKLLRNTAKLQSVLQEAIALVLPARLQAAALQQLHTKFPSASTVRRSEATLDAAFMSFWRRVLRTNPPPLVYFWADASPQGGHEWLVSSYLQKRS